MPRPTLDGLLWSRPGQALGLLALGVCLYELGRAVAEGNARIIGLVVVVAVGLVAAHAQPTNLVLALVIVSPLPLYVRGMGAPVTPILVFGVWLSIAHVAATMPSDRSSLLSFRPYAPSIGLLLAATLLSLTRGDRSATSADLGAFWRVVVGVAIFCACLVCLRTPRAVRNAYVGLATAGGVAVLIAAIQIVSPDLVLPGLSTSAGQIQQDTGTANLRAYGPIGDFELLGEMLALTAVVLLALALRSRGHRRLLWVTLLPLFFLGITATSTRSSFVILLLGSIAILVVVTPIEGRRTAKTVTAIGVLLVLIVPTLHFIQGSFGTGYLFQRFETTSTSNGLSQFVGPRTQLWSSFGEHLPHGPDLLFGTGPAFDYAKYQTYPHSLPLTMVFTVGLLGLISFYALLCVIAMRCLKAWRQEGLVYPFVGLVLVTLFVINEMKIEYLRQYNYQWFIWAMLGICAASAELRFRPSQL